MENCYEIFKQEIERLSYLYVKADTKSKKKRLAYDLIAFEDMYNMLSLEEMEKIHIQPFKAAINNDIEMIMVAHLHCTCFDKKTIPASLSKNVISYLRNNLNYNGVLISDDMVMKGVQDYGNLEAVIMGIKAGLDMFIFRDSEEKTLNMINKLVNFVEKDEVLQKRVIESNKRIESLKQKYM